MDLCQYLISLLLLTVTVFNLDWFSLDTRRCIASFLMILLWGKMFDWMRLFDSTSFYIFLIVRTVKDMLPFTIIILLVTLTIYRGRVHGRTGRRCGR